MVGSPAGLRLIEVRHNTAPPNDEAPDHAVQLRRQPSQEVGLVLVRVRVPLAEPEAVLLSSEDAPAREAAGQGGDAAGACHELIFVSSADGEKTSGAVGLPS